MSHAASCPTCGAPDDGELVHCRYCKNPQSAEALRTAIPCPRCRTACRWGKQKCPVCQAWIVVSCVFCGAISPHNAANCMNCREPFAGAPERKAAMEAQHRQQQDIQMLGAFGSIAAPFLGAALGAAIADASPVSSVSSDGWDLGSSDEARDDYDVSNVVEDSDDGAGDW